LGSNECCGIEYLAMTPGPHVTYAACLYFALLSLLKWSQRRHRVSHSYRRELARALADRVEPGRLR
jgi:hypothetical protein